MDSSLYQAVISGDDEKLKLILASHYGDDDSLILLLHQKTTPFENNCLHLAVQSKDLSCVEAILSRCPPCLLTQPNLVGDTPLHIAARLNSFIIASCLLVHADHLVSVSSSTSSWRPRCRKCEEALFSSTLTLAQKQVRMVNKKKNTALHEALQNLRHTATTENDDDEDLTGITITTESIVAADRDFRYNANGAGETPLYIAIEAGCRRDVILMLVRCSSPGGPRGRTALHAAVIYTRPYSDYIIRSLLEMEKDIIKVSDDYGRTALHYASYHGNIEMVRQLIEADPSTVCMTDYNGNTALHVAASMYNRISVIKELAKASPVDCCKMQDKKGRNFLHVAAENGVLDVFHHFLCNRKQQTRMMDDYLINERDYGGNTPLHLAASRSNISTDVLQILCSYESVNKRVLNTDSHTALDLVENNMLLGVKGNGVYEDHLWQAHKCLTEANACRSYWPKEIIKDDEVLILLEKKIQHSYEKSSSVLLNKGTSVAEQKSIEMEKVSNTHLVVAALIATVTFAVGFTLPGGYNSQGMAVLTKKPAFMSFIASNTLAMILSTFVVLVHFSKRIVVSSRYRDPQNHLLKVAFYSTFSAISAMVVAFVTGTYSVLLVSPGPAISLSILRCSFFLLFGYLSYNKVIEIMRSSTESTRRSTAVDDPSSVRQPSPPSIVPQLSPSSPVSQPSLFSYIKKRES